MNCLSCGREVPSGSRFCPACGTPLVKTDEERRIVTVLFADIVGFTRLAEALDPEDVKRRVDACFDRLTTDITSFGGVVDKVLGDAIIALFGAPVAHEDDAERAVRAGLRMQQTLKAMATELQTSFRMRVGINTGEVLVGSSAVGRDYTAMGDVVNLASRLQSMAEPGQVLVGASTQAATAEAISYQEVGELEIRGREGALPSWIALNAVRPPGARTRRSTTFVGRRRELELLHAQASLAAELEQAQMATILGEAGTGKTRLVEEAAGQFAARFGARVLEGRCVPYGEANVWWPVAEIIRHAFGLAFEATEAEAMTTVGEGLVTFLSLEADSPDLDRIRIALLHAMGYETPLRGGDRSRNRAEVTMAMTRLVEVELARRPVVFILSDVHWAGEAVWVLVRHLLNELYRSPLLVLVTARRSELSEVVEGRFGSLSLELGPLEAEASLDLVNSLGLDLDNEAALELVERSGGNPFFLEELVGLVGRGGAAAPAHGRSGLDTIPDNLRGILAARLDRLDSDAKQLLERASVLGRTGSVSGLANMSEASGGVADITEPLATLAEADLIVVEGDRYGFVSDLVREVAYGTLTKSARAQLHAGIAAFLEEAAAQPIRNSTAVAIAQHYGAAADTVSNLTEAVGVDAVAVTSKALYWLSEAGRRALEAGVPAEAVDWFSAGLDLSADDPTRARFLYGRAKARCEIRDVSGTRADLERLEPLTAHDPILAARSLVIAGDIDQKSGDLDRAAAQLREAADRLDVLGERSEQSLALRLLGLTEMFRGDDLMAVQALNSARTVAVEAADRRQEAWATQSLAWLSFRAGRVSEAAAFVAEAEDAFGGLEDRGGLAWTRGVAAWVAFHNGNWERADELVAEVLPETRRRGDPWAEAIMLGLQGAMALWSGAADDAQQLAQQAYEVAVQAEEGALVVQAKAVQGRALISLGRVAEGLSVLEDAFALGERLLDSEAQRIAVIANCAASARLGDGERAIRWAARFEGNHADPTIVGESDLSVSLALAMLQRGAVAEAASQMSWLDSADPEFSSSYAAAVGGLVAAAEGDLETAFSKADSVLTGRGTYLDRTFAHLAHAAVAARKGLGSEVDHHLAEARRTLESTDDHVTPLIVDLLAAVCGRAPLEPTEEAMESLGLHAAGWRQALVLASTPGSVAV